MSAAGLSRMLRVPFFYDASLLLVSVASSLSNTGLQIYS